MGTLVRPNNWTAGVYRGGRRPIDMYWRIKLGIAPSGMPPFGGTDEQLWTSCASCRPYLTPIRCRTGFARRSTAKERRREATE